MPQIENNVCFKTLPKRREVIRFVYEVRDYFFPGYFENTRLSDEKYREKKLKLIKKLYKKYICASTWYEFIETLPQIEKEVNQDIDFFMESDPSIDFREEVIISFPGFLAIYFYRIAHVISDLGVNYVPRIISEEAHSKTGIDIHPRAKIGSPFFIDHGTGIVIGETSEIGKYVKLYHGVTLGALSLKEGRELKGTKRHPTIKDRVTVYAGTCILGGNTVIENDVTIGSNIFIVNKVIKEGETIYYNPESNKK